MTEVDVTPTPAMEVRDIVEAMSHVLAVKVAQDPAALDHIEWRMLEHLLFRVFSGLGFNVTLTPESKDGGKDLILACTVDTRDRSYIVEVKHWRSGQRVGANAVRSFLHVIGRERRDGGIYLSTYGYARNAFESLSQIDRERLRFGAKEKVVAFCRSYVRSHEGTWRSPSLLADLLYEHTE